jgi:hypothetical protein
MRTGTVESNDVKALVGRVKLLERELSQVEWSAGSGGQFLCPCCYADKDKDEGMHDPKCGIALLLNRKVAPL